MVRHADAKGRGGFFHEAGGGVEIGERDLQAVLLRVISRVISGLPARGPIPLAASAPWRLGARERFLGMLDEPGVNGKAIATPRRRVARI